MQLKSVIRQNKRYFFLMIVLDFLFLLTLANIMFVFFVPASDKVLRMTDIVQSEFQSASLEQLQDFDARLSGNSEFMELYGGLLVVLAKFFLYCLLAWFFLKSLVWYLSHKSFLKVIPFWRYIGKFAAFSVFWFVVILAALAVSAFVSSKAFVSLVHGGTILFWLLFLVVFYFAQISFALLPSTKTFKNTFVFGVKRIKKIGVAYIINIVLSVTALAVMFYCAKYSVTVGFLVLFFLVLPVFVFCRFNMIVASWARRL